MGLNNRNSDITYIKCADGKFFLSSDKEKATPYDELSGIITDFRFKEDEWEGQKVRKLNVTMKDGDETYVVSLRFDSSYVSSMINFLKSADLTQPLSISPRETEEADRATGKIVKRQAILVSQEGKGVKAYYSKATDRALPAWEKLTVNKKTVWDKSAFLDELERIVVEEFIPTVTSLAPVSKVEFIDQNTNTDEAAAPVKKAAAIEMSGDDLPWES